ncbi:MAG TPA: inositol monophosphatase [Dehalococcoidia bacterium]|nr:inositol monophosphatase [Dehalococcoidia bacterium]
MGLAADTPVGRSLPQARSGRSAVEVARLAAREAGRLIMANVNRSQVVHRKGRGDLVTDVDLAVERSVIELLAAEYPDHGILSEETSPHQRGDGWLWVIDPVDGTRNYASAIPLFCFNLALCHDRQPALALTYDPVRRESFFATRGGGAWLGRRRIRVSQKESVRASVIGMDMGYDDERARRLLDSLLDLWPGMQAVRIMGSGALGLAYVACGRYDLYIHHLLYPWDIAAGILLVQEAGGIVTDRDGAPVTIESQGIIAGGPTAHADLARLVVGTPWR